MVALFASKLINDIIIFILYSKTNLFYFRKKSTDVYRRNDTKNVEHSSSVQCFNSGNDSELAPCESYKISISSHSTFSIS